MKENPEIIRLDFSPVVLLIQWIISE